MQLAELEHLARQTKDHVIQLNNAAFDHFAGGKRRPYALIIFLTARHLVDKPQLQLGKLRREFGLLSAQVTTCWQSLVLIPPQSLHWPLVAWQVVIFSRSILQAFRDRTLMLLSCS